MVTLPTNLTKCGVATPPGPSGYALGLMSNEFNYQGGVDGQWL